MTAIETYFIGPTNTRGSRYKAVAMGTGHKVTLSADDRLDAVDNHDRAAFCLAMKLGWMKAPDNEYGDCWFRGDGGKRGYVYVCAVDYSKLENPVVRYNAHVKKEDDSGPALAGD